MRIAYGSDVGRKRAKNEDSVGNFKNRSNVVFVILADGLGGYQGGEVASEMAVSHLGYLFEQTELNNSNDAKVWLEEKLSCENQMIIERSKQYQNLEGMGTTVVCAMFFENK
ncbi:MAG: protein phosphatase 2C domain-containing protein, partial [Ligilactobacillus ruminis]|nr:protein phosphatase 2C domain-containing protein [Ligilactobacillus ruminis]